MPTTTPTTLAYDPATPLGQVRFHIADTNTDDPLFSDEELNAQLNLNGQNPHFAAAAALDALAADAARIAREIRIGRFQEDDRSIAANLRESATRLRSQADITSLYCAPNPVFTTDRGECPGTMSGW